MIKLWWYCKWYHSELRFDDISVWVGQLEPESCTDSKVSKNVSKAQFRSYFVLFQIMNRNQNGSWRDSCQRTFSIRNTKYNILLLTKDLIWMKRRFNLKYDQQCLWICIKEKSRSLPLMTCFWMLLSCPLQNPWNTRQCTKSYLYFCRFMLATAYKTFMNIESFPRSS